MRTMMKTLAAAALCAGLVSACGGDDEAARAKAAAEAKAFDASQLAWRKQRREHLTAPDGWTSLIGLHWIDAGSHYIGSDPDNGIHIAKGPAHLGMLSLDRNHALRFVPEKGVAVTVDGQPLTGGIALKTDADESGPTALLFDEGKGIATVIERGDRYALRVKHADADSRVHFSGLAYWPGGRDWIVTGKFVPHPPGRTIPIVNIIGMTEEMRNPGAIEFTRGEKTYRIEALEEEPGADQLFLIYADRTSGHGSYPAGRYLYVDLPDAHGKVTLDFNRGYNPPCAFTAFATCPLPPPENRLDLPIEAGEKAYAKPHPAAT